MADQRIIGSVIYGLGALGLATLGVVAGVVSAPVGAAVGLSLAVHAIAAFLFNNSANTDTTLGGAAPDGYQVLQVTLPGGASSSSISGATYDSGQGKFVPNSVSPGGSWTTQADGTETIVVQATSTAPAGSASISADGKTYTMTTPVPGGWSTMAVSPVDTGFVVHESVPLQFTAANSTTGQAPFVRTTLVSPSGAVQASSVSTVQGPAQTASAVSPIPVSSSFPTGGASPPVTGVNTPGAGLTSTGGGGSGTDATVSQGLAVLHGDLTSTGTIPALAPPGIDGFMSPLESLLNPLKAFTPTAQPGVCPIGSGFDFFGHHYAFTVFCDLLEQQSALIGSAMTLVYALGALFIVLSA